jgi:hypothetical protein
VGRFTIRCRKCIIHVSGLFPDNGVVFPICSWGFEGFGANKFNDLDNKHLAPKAEVTGSNPVGCANDFKGLLEFWLFDF